MREIKFRAWDKKRNLIEPLVYGIYWMNGGIKADGQGITLGEDGWVTEDNGFQHECDVVLMQYTGLKDKNGIEIYEGDIVENTYTHPEDKEYTNTLIRIVEWSPHFGFNGVGNNSYRTEVIGNIYENPELLNK